MTDNNDDTDDYMERRHSPIIRMEKNISVLRKDIEGLKLREATRQGDDKAEKDKVAEIKETLYDKEGLCDKARDFEGDIDQNKDEISDIKKTLYGDEGLVNQARDYRTTLKNIYIFIIVVGLIVGTAANWRSCVKQGTQTQGKKSETTDP